MGFFLFFFLRQMTVEDFDRLLLFYCVQTSFLPEILLGFSSVTSFGFSVSSVIGGGGGGGKKTIFFKIRIDYSNFEGRRNRRYVPDDCLGIRSFDFCFFFFFLFVLVTLWTITIGFFFFFGGDRTETRVLSRTPIFRFTRKLLFLFRRRVWCVVTQSRE